MNGVGGEGGAEGGESASFLRNDSGMKRGK